MNTPFDPTLESDIKELMKEVPAPIRAVFASGKVETVAKNLMQKNQLHIDQGAVMEREIILLLLGLKSPDEFTKALTEEANLNQQTINSISKDVNDQIFVPLREEMRKGGVKVEQPVRTAAASAPPRPVNASVPNYSPPLQSPRYVSPENKSASARPTQTALNTERPLNPAPTELSENASLRDVLAAVTAPHPLDNEKLLEDHEEPHIEFKPPIPQPIAPPSPVVSSAAPSVAFSEGRGAGGPPQNLPGALPPPAPAKPYSTDPYHEPIDEK